MPYRVDDESWRGARDARFPPGLPATVHDGDPHFGKPSGARLNESTDIDNYFVFIWASSFRIAWAARYSSLMT